jgi:hypothetical protein
MAETRTAAASLTQGLPEPRHIEQQRMSYMKSLDDQLKQGADVLNKQLKQQQEYLLRMGDQQKKSYGLQVDQQIKHQELDLVQQHNQQLLMLQQAAQQQKAALEQQANALLLEYNQKKAQEDLTNQMCQFENDAAEAKRKYESEMRALQTAQAAGAQQLAKQGEVLAAQATQANMQAMQAHQVTTRTAASLGIPVHGMAPSLPPVVSITPTASYAPPPISVLPPGTVQAIPTTMVPSAVPRELMAGPYPGYSAVGTFSTPRTSIM